MNDVAAKKKTLSEKGITGRKLLVAAIAMFGFGYSLVPIYRAICDVSGINFLTNRDPKAEAFAKNTQVDATRKVSIEFDANVHGGWQLKPSTNAIDVHPGELTTVTYKITNTLNRTSTGQAIPSFAPDGSGQYFHKLQCFCFSQQTLGPNESREFPVVFVVDPKMPAEINTITLSYAFFEIEGLPTAKGAGE